MPSFRLSTDLLAHAAATLALSNNGPLPLQVSVAGYLGAPSNGSGQAGPVTIAAGGRLNFTLAIPLNGTLKPGTYPFLIDVYAWYQGQPVPTTPTREFQGADPVIITSASALLLGDVDGDGQLTDNDLARIAWISAGFLNGGVLWTPAQLWAADVNQDGRVDQADYDLMTRVRLGQATLPAVYYPG